MKRGSKLILLLILFISLNVSSKIPYNSHNNYQIEEKLNEQDRKINEEIEAIKIRTENDNEKLELKKSYLDFEKDHVYWWLNILGILIAFFGILIPVVGFVIGRRIYIDIHAQKKEVNDEITKMQSLIGEIHTLHDDVKKHHSEAKEYSIALKKMEDEGKQSIKIIEQYQNTISNTDLSKINIKKEQSIINGNTEVQKEIELTNAINEADQLFHSKHYSGAIIKYNVILNSYGSIMNVNQLAYVNFYIAYSYYNNSDAVNAIAYYTKSIEIYPNSSESYNNRGTAYLRSGDSSSAIKDYLTAIKMSPKIWNSYVNLISIYNSKNQFDLAIRFAYEAIKASIENADVYYSLGNAYYGKADYTSAISYYSKAIELSPIAPFFSNRSNAYSALTEFDKALSDLKEAMKLDVKYVNANIFLSIAEIYIMENNVFNAMEYINKALKSNPDNFKVTLIKLFYSIINGENVNDRKIDEVIKLSFPGAWSLVQVENWLRSDKSAFLNDSQRKLFEKIVYVISPILHTIIMVDVFE